MTTGVTQGRRTLGGIDAGRRARRIDRCPGVNRATSGWRPTNSHPMALCPDCGTEPLEHRKSPWYFKFMLVASVIYLGYRAFQGVTWVVHHV